MPPPGGIVFLPIAEYLLSFCFFCFQSPACRNLCRLPISCTSARGRDRRFYRRRPPCSKWQQYPNSHLVRPHAPSSPCFYNFYIAPISLVSYRKETSLQERISQVPVLF